MVLCILETDLSLGWTINTRLLCRRFTENCWGSFKSLKAVKFGDISQKGGGHIFGGGILIF